MLCCCAVWNAAPFARNRSRRGVARPVTRSWACSTLLAALEGYWCNANAETSRPRILLCDALAPHGGQLFRVFPISTPILSAYRLVLSPSTSSALYSYGYLAYPVDSLSTVHLHLHLHSHSHLHTFCFVCICIIPYKYTSYSCTHLGGAVPVSPAPNHSLYPPSVRQGATTTHYS